MIVLQGARERVELLQFSPDGHTVTVAWSCGVQLWHGLESARPTTNLIGTSDIHSLRFSPDGRNLLLSSSGLALLDLTTGTVCCSAACQEQEPLAQIESLAQAPPPTPPHGKEFLQPAAR